MNPSGGHEASGVPGASPKEENLATRDVVSLPWFSLRRARSVRLRQSASGLRERSAADDADAARAEPYPPRLVVGEASFHLVPDR